MRSAHGKLPVRKLDTEKQEMKRKLKRIIFAFTACEFANATRKHADAMREDVAAAHESAYNFRELSSGAARAPLQRSKEPMRRAGMPI